MTADELKGAVVTGVEVVDFKEGGQLFRLRLESSSGRGVVTPFFHFDGRWLGNLTAAEEELVKHRPNPPYAVDLLGVGEWPKKEQKG